MVAENRGPFAGVLSPVLTPFGAGLKPDAARFVVHCRWLLENGCTGLAPFGTTSEGNSLSVGEREALLEAIIDGGIDPRLLMPGTGCASLEDSVRLTGHAVEHGCGGVLMLPPFYYKGVADDGLYASFAEVIQRLGDERLRIYLYHIPPQAVVGFSLALIERLVADYPTTVVGLKESSGDWDNTANLLQAIPGFGAFSGSEDFLLANLRAGGVGCITAMANVNSAAIRKLHDNWQVPEAGALQQEISAFRKTILRKPVIPALKSLLAHYRGDPGWRLVRPPLMALGEGEGAELASALEADHGFAMGGF